MPSSGWAISRPRNCSVTLTLCPSWMNWSTLRTFTSKSPRPIFGRNLTSLTDTLRRLPPGLLGLLGFLVPELAVVHDPADRRVGHRGHLDQIELETPGQLQCFGDRLDPQLIAVRSDEADLTSSDAVVDAVLFALVALRRGYGCSLLCNGCCLPVRWCSVGSTRSPRSAPIPPPGEPGRRHQLPLDLDALDARGGQVGVAPTSL